MPRFLICFGLLAGLMSTPALAYVGPGSGLGIIGVVFGIIGTVVLSLVSLVWYPIKRAHRRIRAALARGGKSGR
ncbi:hypothetical protein MTR62_05265 [Novosphingobium sp. 1949]|uniref:Uncharacterized protein n=1 Tax=Novosphingobium organovorum TaxID=2930092 RepID=A0ABT0BBE1_9SPHN|nr:hypothetical protein [Novosphingobium organovorum]MCJ2182114.1 hypothetical protein [Novosphingobium organovorum]